MKKLNYEKLMEHKPTELSCTSNSADQHIQFFEDPIRGDEGYVIGVIDKVAFYTDFYETSDFYQGSDYNPVLLDDGSVVSEFEL